MRHRLLCNYTRGGATLPPGTVLDDLAEAEVADLEGLIEPAGEPPAEGPAPGVAEALAALLDADPDRSDPKRWTKDGKPRTEALSLACRRVVSADERDEAWTATNLDARD